MFHILLLLWIRFSPSLAEGIQCGQPGRPANGTLLPSGKTYFPGEKVTYSCLEGFVLFGNDGRTCLKNGTWSGKVPLCDFNLAKGKRSLQSATLWSYVPSLAVDGNRDTCSFTPKGPEPRWWQVHLGHKFNVVSIGVTISPGSFQEFTIFVIELLSNNKALYKPCTEFKGVFQTHKGLFKCNDGLGHPGQYVYIRDDREEEQYFGLCEVEVFAFRERIPCGEPEIPISGTSSRVGEDKAVYSCEGGHKLEGDTVLMCSSKGEWQGHPPKCKEVLCDAPPLIQNGFIEIGNGGGDYVYGIEAKYSCSTGYVLRGSRTRICKQNGNWSDEAPICKTVTCGDPPAFDDAKYTFLNGTSGHWTGIVIYTCVDGFKLHPDNGDTVSTCLETGSWRPVNVTCVPIRERVEYIVRETEGRALDYSIPDQESGSRSDPQLVIILAVIAGVLAVGMIIFGILLLRRRLMPSLGSLSPLVIRNNGLDGADSSIKANTGVRTAPPAPPTYDESMNKSSNHFHTNLLQGIGTGDYQTRFSYSSGEEICSVTDPHYEQVNSRYEHNYESLPKKKKNSKECDDNSSSHDTTYESVSSDKESVGYETVSGPKDPGYEVINGKDPGYEVVKDHNESGYEVVPEKSFGILEKEPGYETIPSAAPEPGYEIVSPANFPQAHGYETLKPKLPPRELESEVDVPDILQDISSLSESIEVNALQNIPNKSEVPADILALYAKVDKSKKNRKPKNVLTSITDSPPIPANHPILDSNSTYRLNPVVSVDSSSFSRDYDRVKDLTRKFNQFSPEDSNGCTSPSSMSSEGSLSSSGSSLRPLPPLPQ